MFGKKKKKAETSVTLNDEPGEKDKKYKMLFRCELCGKVFASNENFTDSEMGVGDVTHSKHYCDNGDIGRCEFLGMRLIEKIRYDEDHSVILANEEEEKEDEQD